FRSVGDSSPPHQDLAIPRLSNRVVRPLAPTFRHDSSGLGRESLRSQGRDCALRRPPEINRRIIAPELSLAQASFLPLGTCPLLNNLAATGVEYYVCSKEVTLTRTTVPPAGGSKPPPASTGT